MSISHIQSSSVLFLMCFFRSLVDPIFRFRKTNSPPEPKDEFASLPPKDGVLLVLKVVCLSLCKVTFAVAAALYVGVWRSTSVQPLGSLLKKKSNFPKIFFFLNSPLDGLPLPVRLGLGLGRGALVLLTVPAVQGLTDIHALDLPGLLGLVALVDLLLLRFRKYIQIGSLKDNSTITSLSISNKLVIIQQSSAFVF